VVQNSIITDAPARLRTLHRAEDIGSALKGGVNVLISNRAGARKQS
jgi:hypothetical protein